MEWMRINELSQPESRGCIYKLPLPNSHLLTGFRRLSTRDINKVEPFLPRDYAYRYFPKIAELPDETKTKFIETFGRLIFFVGQT